MARPRRRGDGTSGPDLDNVAVVNDTPEEPERGEPGPEESGNFEDPEARQRGWIDPADRVWRHPSEIGGGSGRTPMVLNAPHHHASRSAAMVLVGVAAAVAAVAWVIVLLSPASDQPERQDSAELSAGGSMTTLAGIANAVPPSATAAGRAMVELRARTAGGTVSVIGVAVAEGGLVVTTADSLSGARDVTAVGPNGSTMAASVVAVDPGSDVALVDVPEDLPVAPFADDTDLAGGSSAMLLTLVPAGGPRLALHSTPGSVTGVAEPIADGPARGMPSITSSPPAPLAGAPLLDAGGSVVGILYLPDGGAAGAATFLPSSLVVGVADDLRSGGKVVPGWLGISGTDVPGGGGALVGSVDPGGPAAEAHLQAGQVVVGVDGLPVRSMAELRARLYVLTPGDAVALSVQQASGTRVVDVVLGKSS